MNKRSPAHSKTAKYMYGAILALMLSVLSSFLICCTSHLEAVPGTIEDGSGTALLEANRIAQQLNISDKQFVIFYFSPEGDYEDKAIWLWRSNGGDGAKNFPYTQDFKVKDGLGYMIFAQDGSDLGEQPILDPQGQFSFIIRGKESWEGQTADFIWSVAKNGNKVLYEDGMDLPVALGEYEPHFISAKLEDRKTIKVRLSGRYALAPNSSSGFAAYLNSVELPLKNAQSCYSKRSNENYTDCVILTLSKPLQKIGSLEISHPAHRTPVTVNMASITADLANQTIPPIDFQLGVIYQKNASEFRLWAPLATTVSVLLYKESYAVKPEGEPQREEDLVLNPKTGVWSSKLEGDWNGWFYEYEVQNQQGVHKVLDPYAKSMDAYLNQGGPGRAAVVDLSHTEPDWGAYQDIALPQREDAIIYEANIRDFTISPDSGVSGQKGSFLAFVSKIPYLQELGITHVQFMPLYNFYYTDETQQNYENRGTTTNNNYNWGYDPHNWFTPEGWYSSDPKVPAKRIQELKILIRELHRAGIGVIIDVVFNHMAQTSLYEDIVPNYYFRQDHNGFFTNKTGVGNDIASTRPMVRKLISDAIYYWAKEFHIDGFRFDLMGILDSKTILQAYERVRKLPGKADILFEGEGWKMYNGPSDTFGMDQNFMTRTDSVSVFNDELRDLLKAGGFNEEGLGFLTGSKKAKRQIFENLLGEPQVNYTADDPGDSMAYVAAHDGLTLHDAIANNMKLNPRTERSTIARRAKLANLLLLTGQSIPFLHSGQERGRSKPNINNSNRETIGAYVRNSYDSSDNINQIVWTLEPEYKELLDYTKGLIAMRKSLAVFRMGNAQAIRKAAVFLPQENDFALSYSLTQGQKRYYILLNADTAEAQFLLPQPLKNFQVLVDPYDVDIDGLKNYRGLLVTGDKIQLEAIGAAVLVEEL